MGTPDAGTKVNFEELTPQAVASLAADMAEVAVGARSRKRVAERLVSLLYDKCVDAEGTPAAVLARCFQTCAYAQMPMDYQSAADRLLDVMPSHADMRCLALLGTRGQKITWNDVATSIGHQAIPLPSVEVVRRAPMIARLISEFGLSPEQLLASPGPARGESRNALNVFHVADAENSPFIPAQDGFVRPFGVRSVLGVGGLLPEGNLFAVLLFLRVPLSHKAAELFQALGSAVSGALGSCAVGKTFPRSADMFLH